MVMMELSSTINDIEDYIFRIKKSLDELETYDTIDYRCKYNDAEDKLKEIKLQLSFDIRSLNNLLNNYLNIKWYYIFKCKVCLNKYNRVVIELHATNNQQYYCVLKLFRDLDCIIKLYNDCFLIE